jgi:hypothetical protein
MVPRQVERSESLQVGIAELLSDLRRLTQEVRAFRADVGSQMRRVRRLCLTTRQL